MKKMLTIIYAYYDNPMMFVVQQKEWAKYPDAIREQIEFIVVDDCSPRWPCWRDLKLDVDIKIFRMLEDIPWNMDACRNLAVSKSDTNWIFISDMDHLLPIQTIKEIFHHMGRLNIEKFYTFERVNAPDLTSYKPHPNTYLLTRGLYDKVGGYDETFAGHYGTDGHFRRALLHHSKGQVMLNIPIVRYPREVISDASTTTLDRKKGRSQELGKKYRELSAQNLQEGIKPKTLSFPWEQLC